MAPHWRYTRILVIRSNIIQQSQFPSRIWRHQSKYEHFVCCGVMWCVVVWCGVVWCNMVWCDVVWCAVMWCGAMWCDVIWCGAGCIEVRFGQGGGIVSVSHGVKLVSYSHTGISVHRVLYHYVLWIWHQMEIQLHVFNQSRKLLIRSLGIVTKVQQNRKV